MKKLNIALFCSTLYQTPPENKSIIYAPLYLVQSLAEILNQKGHNITLFATKGSKTKAPIHDANIQSLSKNQYFQKIKKGKDKKLVDKLVLLNDQRMLVDLYQRAPKFDIIHIHHLYPALALSSFGQNTPTLLTYHSPFFEYEQKILSLYKQQKNFSISALSKSHQNNIPKSIKTFVVYNGLRLNNYQFNEKPKNNYIAFAGRLIKEKGPHTAIKVAKKLDAPLRIAGKRFYSKEYNNYWDSEIRPYLNSKIKHIGMKPFKQLPSFYQKAKVLLFPIQWNEAFGLVMIESMACGTPVVAFNHGAVGEVVKEGETGFIVKNEKEMIKAVKKIYEMPEDEYIAMRHKCREHVENNFSIEKMADNYEKLYYKIIKEQKRNKFLC